MSKETKKIIGLVLASIVFFAFFSIPLISKVVNNVPIQLAKDPDGDKYFPISPDRELLEKGAIPKQLILEDKKKQKNSVSLYRQFASFCAPIANIAGAVLPAISIPWSVVIWIRSRKKGEEDDG